MKVLAIYVLSFPDSLFVKFVLLSPCIVRFGGFGMGGCWVLGGNCFLITYQKMYVFVLVQLNRVLFS